MQDPALETRLTEVRTLMEERLRVRGADLHAQIDRAGRRLPRRIRRDLRVLADAERHAGHPKLSRQSDPARVARARDEAVRYLKTVNPGEARKTALLNTLAAIGFNLLLFGGLLLALLRWRGLI